ncbi:hypothetical protein [Wenyingzhuangia sp. 2_MG-2023]|uniref:hypothetical protein n=1 Tax=Wenyingzhuangia sp. 2_MG-2023 TaxID=3062639 RepID=UPI0026E46411|nr:hypothetical protein [Wenyingzhuangia sp. 2_MG-2023]MDO6737073.1 hypothetical protein [Wenyingzhuangia sp. 2_MG-2023]
MKNHTKIYLKAFGYDLEMSFSDQFIPCEICGAKGNDVHHIVNREDRIENLMFLTRDNHIKYGEKVKTNAMLLKIHRRALNKANIPYDNEWFESWIKHYEAKSELRNLQKTISQNE